MKKQKMPRDVNQRAKATLDLITGDAQPEPEREKDPRAVELGRLGGVKGGKRRAAGVADHVWTFEEMAALLD